MDKPATLARIRAAGLLAVIRGPSPDLALQMAAALVAGGVSGIEITYSTPEAARVVKTLRREYGEGILLGMGTLTETGQSGEALEAGSEFLVSPHCDPELGRAMLATGLLVMLGALTPTEVFQAHRLGAHIVKIFPGSLVGPSYIKALHGPFPGIAMMPTGGVSLENIGDWFRAGAVAVGAGSELCPPALAAEGRFDEITARAQKFSQAVQAAMHAG
jgi:2-dehydro-3-deoxyphosphogluconate aldolase / (4S)-4-hydroxy-2-oxoglutarate aldolase